jgi:hypothetical protein
LALGGSTALGTVAAVAARVALTALVLGVPTACMGGTLPALARAVTADEGDERRRRVALLYAVNTLGAFVGALATTFVVIERLGTRDALLAAAALNLCVAIVASWLPRGTVSAPPAPGASKSDAACAPAVVLAASALVGFAFFLMEMVFARMLAPLLGGTVYTFGLVLSVALFGIGLGSALYTLVFSRRVLGVPAFATTCLLESASLALPYALGDRLAVLALRLRSDGVGIRDHIAGWTLVTAIVVLPASVVSGFQFPVLVGLLGRGGRAVARHVGLAYAWNTVGAIAGALAGGFGLMRALSATGCWQAVVILLAATGLAATFVARRSTSRRRAWPLVGAAWALAAAVFVATGPTAAWRDSPIGAARLAASLVDSPPGVTDFIRRARGKTAWAVDGLEARVSVTDSNGYVFLVNGKADGACRGDAATQVMGGLLGALLHPGARAALVIGLGTGSTAGWLARVPSLDAVDVVEIEPAVREVARLCAPVNEHALDDPKVHVILGDAREVLSVSRRRYDMVFSEPSNPYRAGVATLYTREYYERALDHLSPGGLFLQWVQSYEVDAATMQTIFATLSDVFPEVELWFLSRGDLAFVASREVRGKDAGALRARIATEPFSRALRATWGTASLEGVLAHFVARAPTVRGVASRWGGPHNTDDRPVVEFGFARGLGGPRLDVTELPGWVVGAGDELPELTGDAIDRERVALEGAEEPCVDGEEPGKTPSGATDDTRARLQFERHLPTDPALALAAWGEREPLTVVEERHAAMAAVEARDPRASLWLDQLARTEPIEALIWRARSLFGEGRSGEAADVLTRAFDGLRTDPWVSRRAMVEALSVAGDLARDEHALAPRMVDLLLQPFAIELQHDARLKLAVVVASRIEGAADCRRVLSPLEPFTPWDLEVLEYRRDCYRATGDPRAELAADEVRRDLEEWSEAKKARDRKRP